MKNNFQSKLKKNKSSRFKKTKLKKRLQKGGIFKNHIKYSQKIEKEINFDTLITEFEELRYGYSFDSQCRYRNNEISKLFKKPEDCDRFHLELAQNVHIKKTIFGVSQGNDKIAKELLASLEQNCENHSSNNSEISNKEKKDFLRKAFKIDKDNIKPEQFLNLFYTEKENKEQEEQEEQEQSIENKTIENFTLKNIESIIFNVFKVNTGIEKDKCDLSNKIFILLRVLSVILSNKIELENELREKLFKLLQNKIEYNIEKYLNSSQNGGGRDNPESYYQRTNLFGQNVNSISKIGKHKKICKHIFIGIFKLVSGLGTTIGFFILTFLSSGFTLMLIAAFCAALASAGTTIQSISLSSPTHNFDKALSNHKYSKFFKSILEKNDFKKKIEELEKKLTLNNILPDYTLENVNLLVKNFMSSILEDVDGTLLVSLKDKKKNIKAKLMQYIYDECLDKAKLGNHCEKSSSIIIDNVNKYLNNFDNIEKLDINISNNSQNFNFTIENEDEFNALMYKMGMYSFQEKGKASEIIKYEIFLSEIGEFIIYICKNKKIPRKVKEYILTNYKTLFSKLIRNTQETFNEVVFEKEPYTTKNVSKNSSQRASHSSQSSRQSTQSARQSSQEASQSPQEASQSPQEASQSPSISFDVPV